jgi:hypothetical protein
MGRLLVGADLGQRAGDRLPADGRDGEQDVAGRHEVPGRRFPGKFSRVAEPPPCGCIWLVL